MSQKHTQLPLGAENRCIFSDVRERRPLHLARDRAPRADSRSPFAPPPPPIRGGERRGATCNYCRRGPPGKRGWARRRGAGGAALA